jgi:hypothetical protein
VRQQAHHLPVRLFAPGVKRQQTGSVPCSSPRVEMGYSLSTWPATPLTRSRPHTDQVTGTSQDRALIAYASATSL